MSFANKPLEITISDVDVVLGFRQPKQD